MLKGLTSDLTGAADICQILTNFSECLAAAYLLPGEVILFSFQSAKEEFTFTDHALVTVVGESATTTRKLVERHSFKHAVVSKVKFETAGHVDRDCELKFRIGEHDVSIDIAKAEVASARDYYKVLTLLARAQASHERTWELGQLALERSSGARFLGEGSGQTLVKQSDETLDWLQALYARTHPSSYREVLEAALREVRTHGKAA